MAPLKTAKSYLDQVRSGRAIEDLIGPFQKAIEQKNQDLNAIVDYDPEAVLAQVHSVEKRRQAGEKLDLCGLPIVIKDNICTTEYKTTCCSKILENYRSPYDASVVERLKKAGAIVLAKSNMDEFGMGSSNENSALGAVKNPWNLDYVSGGSSGGSAAAVAAGMAPIALGSDTGGSVRQPASFCGVVGFKPTYGRVSRYGLVAYGSSLDQIGTMATRVSDIEIISKIIFGDDSNDSTCTGENWRTNESIQTDGMKIGVPKQFTSQNLGEVLTAFNEQLETFAKDGAEIIELDCPSFDHSIATYYITAMAEASSNLSRFDGVRYGFRAPECHSLSQVFTKSRSLGFGAEVKRRIMLGAFVLSSGYHDAYYAKAQKLRHLIGLELEAAFARCDVIAGPTTPTTAFRIGEKTSDPMEMYLADVFTTFVNLTGVPAISVPYHVSGGLPLGLQLVGRRSSDERLLQQAGQIEQLIGFESRFGRGH